MTFNPVEKKFLTWVYNEGHGRVVNISDLAPKLEVTVDQLRTAAFNLREAQLVTFNTDWGRSMVSSPKITPEGRRELCPSQPEATVQNNTFTGNITNNQVGSGNVQHITTEISEKNILHLIRVLNEHDQRAAAELVQTETEEGKQPGKLAEALKKLPEVLTLGKDVTAIIAAITGIVQ